MFVIFEQHLYNFQEHDIDRKTFIGNVIKDYFVYLRKMKVTVPKSLEEPIIEELALQVNTMLVKKIYGCVSIGEFKKKVKPTVKRKARTSYQRLTKPPKTTAA